MSKLSNEMGILSESKIFTKGVVPGLGIAGFLLTGAAKLLSGQIAKFNREKKFEAAVSAEVEKRLKDIKEMSS